MPDTTAANTRTDPSKEDAEGQRLGIEQIGRALDGWRSKIDELLVQVDLGNLDIRDEVRRRLDVAENVYLAARSRLSDARQDVDINLGDLRSTLEKLLTDLGAAFESAEAVLRRSREQN